MPTAYLPYSAATTVQPTRLIINFTVTEADFRDAWVGAYEDTLIITITP
jgi:hypothetical protein